MSAEHGSGGARFVSRSEDHTRQLGLVTGKCLHPGVWVALNGDLGSGKTVFAQGMAGGLEVPDAYYVTSPTFTLINAYPGRYMYYHADLYRLGDSSELESIGFYDLFTPDSVVAVEWADRLPDDFLSEYIDVQIEAVQGDERTIRMTPHGDDAAEVVGNIKRRCEEIQWD